MFSKEMISLLFQVVKSWQVIAITVALVLYMSLVSYTASSYRRPRKASKSRPRRQKAAAIAASAAEMTPDTGDTNADLGLEEAK